MSWVFTPPVGANPIYITGACLRLPPTVDPSPYDTAPPAPRVWQNSENTVWCLTIDYRKQSQGEPGVLGTYRTFERALKALADYAEDRYSRELTDEEASNGAIYGPDKTLEIVEQELEG